jgi:hypothetical protein
VSYHETFWLATAAAAPVIALAAVVAMPDASAAANEVNEAVLDARAAVAEAEAKSMEKLQLAVKQTRIGEDEASEMVLPRPTPPIYVARSVAPGIAAFVNVLVQAALLALALSALATAQNVLPPWVAIALAVAGILLLTVTTQWVALLRGRAVDFRDFTRE